MITSLQNPLVKQLRKLHSAKERHKQDLFLLEGTHLLEEAFVVDYPLSAVCCTQQWLVQHESLWKKVSNSCPRVEVVSQEVIAAIATTVQPDGVIATAKRGYSSTSISFASVVIALETIQDPGNLGTIIRTSAAAEASGLFVSEDCVDLDNPKVLRASAGQWFRLPMAVSPDLKNTVKQAKDAGMKVVATLPTAKLTYWEIDWLKPTMILLGNEGAGLSTELAAMADLQVKIPLNPEVESLNVAITSALILFEAQRQRQML